MPRWVVSAEAVMTVPSTLRVVEAGMGSKQGCFEGLGLVIRIFVLEGTFFRLLWEAMLVAMLTRD